MRRHLHLLHPLRCFDSAARHLSFTRAAIELDVTQAAVSHQIRLLEKSLGTRLFDRLARSVLLTPEGERLAETVSESLARIDSSVDRLMRPDATTRLRLAVAPGFACRWLVPRLPRLRALQPDFELHLQHAGPLEAVDWSQADAALVWTPRRPPQPCARRLFGAGLAPVCAPELVPALATPPRRLDAPAALRHLPLLHEDGYDDWTRWMAAAGAPDEPVRRGQIIDETNALLSAAIAGQGVALARTVLLEDDLRRGRLVAPFALEIEAPGAYWLVANAQLDDCPRFNALWDFLLEEAVQQAANAVPRRRAA